MSGEKILIVEDNAINQKLLVVVLRPCGYQLICARDGEEAINLARSEQPDLILMDLQLPKISGYAATQTLKQSPETADIPVIAMTAHNLQDGEEKAQLTMIGFAGCIIKPISTRTFPGLIERFFKTHTLE